MINQSSTWPDTPFAFQLCSDINELYDIVKQDNMYYLIYKNDYRNKILFSQVLPYLEKSPVIAFEIWTLSGMSFQM